MFLSMLTCEEKWPQIWQGLEGSGIIKEKSVSLGSSMEGGSCSQQKGFQWDLWYTGASSYWLMIVKFSRIFLSWLMSSWQLPNSHVAEFTPQNLANVTNQKSPVPSFKEPIVKHLPAHHCIVHNRKQCQRINGGVGLREAEMGSMDEATGGNGSEQR